MGRWVDRDDEGRLPEGMKRIGYDADTQKYTYEDSDGSIWEGPEGARYGELRRMSTASATTRPSTSDSNDERIYLLPRGSNSSSTATSPVTSTSKIRDPWSFLDSCPGPQATKPPKEEAPAPAPTPAPASATTTASEEADTKAQDQAPDPAQTPLKRLEHTVATVQACMRFLSVLRAGKSLKNED